MDRPEPLTLSEFLVVWHEAHGKELAASTQVSYAGVWDKWIGPRLGGKLLQDLTPAEVARFRAAIEREGAGAATVLRVLAVLGSVLSELVIDAPKTGRTRVVPLLPVVRQELAELQLRRGRPGPAAPIIATSAGEPWSDSPVPVVPASSVVEGCAWHAAV